MNNETAAEDGVDLECKALIHWLLRADEMVILLMAKRYANALSTRQLKVIKKAYHIRPRESDLSVCLVTRMSHPTHGHTMRSLRAWSV